MKSKIASTVVYSLLALAVVSVSTWLVMEWNIERKARAETADLPKPQKRHNLAGIALLERLRQGNLVLFARHFATRHQDIQNDTRHREKLNLEDFKDCS